MRRIVILGLLACPVALVVTLTTSALAVGAPLDPRSEWRWGGGHAVWVNPPCDTEIADDVPFGKAGRVQILEPLVGDKVTNAPTGVLWGHISDVRVRKPRGVATGTVEVSMVGGSAACQARTDPIVPGIHSGAVYVDLALWTPLPRGQRRFHAWTPAGESTLRIRGRQRGTCDQSWINRRADAWRCITQRYVLDPCFESPTDTSTLGCPLTPWHPEGWIVDGSGFDTSKARRPIWGLKTAHGKRCSFLSGAGAPTRQGRRLNYGCSRFGRVGGGYLWGRPRRRGSRLVIPWSRAHTPNSPWRWVRVTERWN